MDIRLATPRDREVWFLLWRMFVEEQYQLGSPIKPETQTWRQYLDLFNSYTEGSLFGCVLLAESDDHHPLGCMMGGELPTSLNFSTTYGKTATIWGVYTIPEYRRQGISKALLTKAREIAVSLGFESMVSDVVNREPQWSNAMTHGAEVISSIICVRLK